MSRRLPTDEAATLYEASAGFDADLWSAVYEAHDAGTLPDELWRPLVAWWRKQPGYADLVSWVADGEMVP